MFEESELLEGYARPEGQLEAPGYRTGTRLLCRHKLRRTSQFEETTKSIQPFADEFAYDDIRIWGVIYGDAVTGGV